MPPPPIPAQSLPQPPQFGQSQQFYQPPNFQQPFQPSGSQSNPSQPPAFQQTPQMHKQFTPNPITQPTFTIGGPPPSTPMFPMPPLSSIGISNLIPPPPLPQSTGQMGHHQQQQPQSQIIENQQFGKILIKNFKPYF